MASLPASGDLTLQDLIDFFGGGTHITDFYRGGGLVPDERAGSDGYWDISYGAWSSTVYSNPGVGPGGDYWVAENGGTANYEAYWGNPRAIDGALPYSFRGYHATDGYFYDRQIFQETISGDDFYSLRRQSYTAVWVPPTPAQSINTGVPASDDISITDFYGAVDS